MDGETIRKLIDANNQKIADILSPAIFILNPEVGELLEENKRLQEQCPHVFKEGHCIFCDKEEE